MRTLHLGSALTVMLATSVFAMNACSSSDDAAGGGAEVDSGSSPTPEGGSMQDSATPSDSASPVDGGADASFVFVNRDINHVLATGQSLSVGAVGSPPLSTMQPFANTMFVTGVIAGGTGLTSFKPLVEATVETMSSSFANLLTKAIAGGPDHDLLVSAHGIGGTAYVGLKKGTTAYANGIAQAQAGHDLALAANKSHVVRAVTNVHGESDQNNNNTNYEANLLEWQESYETDVKAITGQAEPIPMFHTQFSSWTRLSGMPKTSIIPSAQLASHVSAPGKLILVGAKYHLPYVADGVHLTNEGYRHMGEDYAKAYRRVILEGKTWEPVRPRMITRTGAVVTVQMHVPAPPLVLDTTLVTDPGDYGFEWKDDAAVPPTILSVAVTGPETVVITLSAAPTGANKRLRYAYTGVSGALGGPTTGPRGNLRDSDATASRHGYKLYNWCVHFDSSAP